MIVFVLSSAPLFSWQRTYGGAGDQQGYDAIQMSDGDFLCVGTTKTAGAFSSNLFYAHSFDSGFEILTNQVGIPPDNETARSITYTSDGGFAISGWSVSVSSGVGQMYLVKLNNLGNYEWSSKLGPGIKYSHAESVCEAVGGGYLLAGGTNAFDTWSDGYLIKTDADGNCVWSRTYGWEGVDKFSEAAKTADGGYVIAGTTGHMDMWLIKVDAAGNCVWSRTYGDTGSEQCTSMCLTDDGGYVLAGYTYSYGAGGRDLYVIKTDADGNCVWSRTCGGFDADEAESVCRAEDGGYVAAGRTWSFSLGGGGYLAKFDQNGNFQWDKVLGGMQVFSNSVKPARDGGYIIGGTFNSGPPHNDNDMMMIKTDQQGNVFYIPSATPTKTITRTPTITMTPTAMGYSWGGTGLWHEIPDSNADTLTGDARPFTSGSSGTWWYGQDATGNYDTGSWNRGELVTPFVSIGNGQAMYFWSWEQTEKYHSPDFYDQRHVYVSADAGATWSMVRQCYGTEDEWYESYADLSGYASQSVIFKFVFDTDYSAYGNNYRGWFVDDIRIADAPTATVTRTDTPVCSPTSTSTYIPESDWQLANTPGFSARAGHSSVVFGGKMWVIAGASAGGVFSDVWYTDNGVDWVMATGNAEFGKRNMHRCLVFDNRMWLVAGSNGSGASSNDVWYSYNGADWILATSNAQFSPRSGFALLNHDNKMWVVGDNSYLNDVWSSSDGVNWTQVTAGASFPARVGYAGAVFDNKMWIIGGYIGSTPYSQGVDLNDVWYSTDGANWTQSTQNAAFTPRSLHALIVFDGRLWLAGGVDVYAAGIRMNDVWFSSDGVLWYQATSQADFSPRLLHTGESYLGKMWVIAGRYSWTTEYDDAWYSPVGPLPNTTATTTHTNTPFYTPTITPTVSMTPTYMAEIDWTLAAADALFLERSSLSSVSYDCRLWVIGGVNSSGTGYYGDVWYTENGAVWNQATASADFGARYGHTSFEHGGYMWVVGGRKSNGVYQKDVWRSDNGADWRAVTLNAAFPGRGGHTSVIFDGKMWVIGGIVGGSYAADVWYSSNGVNWTRAVANAAFGPRSGHSSVVFDGKMWVVGGTNGINLGDVWYSSDGVSWYKTSDNIGFADPRRGHISLSYNGKIWVIGGQSSVYLDDIWWSSDGYSWQRATDNPGFQGRARHTGAVFKDKMWVIGGVLGAASENDVWYSPPGPVQACGTQTATCTVTDTPDYTATPTPTASRTAIETDWVLATGTAAFTSRTFVSSLSFGGKLWVIGGIDSSGYTNDAWYSDNGADWVLATGNAQFGKRYGQSCLEFNNMIWVTGGRNFMGGNVLDDVWQSADGVNWSRATLNADFGPKVNHAGVVFNNRMWVIGGLNDTTITNDVWSSTDGNDWDNATGNAEFSPRLDHAAVAHDNKIWVIGGNDGNKLNDVWYSSDGVNWVLATASAAFPGRSMHTALVHDGRMWVIGGSNQAGVKLNDVWWSTDGVTWHAANLSADFSGRAGHAAAVFGGKMWVISGDGGGRDVWYSPPGPIGTPTMTPTVMPSASETLTPTVTFSPTETASVEITPTSTEEQNNTCTVTCTATATVTMTPTPSVTPALKLFFSEEPVIYPNPLINDSLKIRINLTKEAAVFSMSVYTAAFRKVKEIKRSNLPSGVSVITVGNDDTGGLAAGIYYFVAAVKDDESRDVSRPSHFMVIRQ